MICLANKKFEKKHSFFVGASAGLRVKEEKKRKIELFSLPHLLFHGKAQLEIESRRDWKSAKKSLMCDNLIEISREWLLWRFFIETF